MTIRSVLTALPFILSGWIAVMALTMRFSDAAPAAVVILPGVSLMTALPHDTQILGMSRLVLTVANRPGMAETLYSSGALLVLPAGLTGCVRWTTTQQSGR